MLNLVNALERMAWLESKIADYDNDYKMIMDEKCSGDQEHCGCVPTLKIKVKELEATIKRVKDELVGMHQMHLQLKHKKRYDAALALGFFETAINGALEDEPPSDDQESGRKDG